MGFPLDSENMRQTEPKGSVIMKIFKSPVCSSKEWQVVPPLGLELVEVAVVFFERPLHHTGLRTRPHLPLCKVQPISFPHQL
jgi:hypothetical protein